MSVGNNLILHGKLPRIKQNCQHLPLWWMLAFLCCGVCLEDDKELLGRVYSVGVTCHLNIIHNKISENILSENFAQKCRHSQMPELLGNIREIGCFKVAAKMLE